MEATGGYSTSGICFYMSTYTEEQIWNTGSYVEVEAKARTAIPGTIIRAAKALNLKDRTRNYQHRNNAGYGDTAPTNKKIYQVSLWFGAGVAPAPRSLNNCNHQIIAAFSSAGTVLFFDPNFGFYLATEVGKTNQKILEEAVQGLYVGIGNKATNFYYLAGRTLS
jgi:hypothetical protein